MSFLALAFCVSPPLASRLTTPTPLFAPPLAPPPPELRDGSCWPFGALTERSRELSGPGLELFLTRAGRDVAARVRVDPSSIGAAGWQAEALRKKRAEEDEKAAEARAARAKRVRAALRAEAALAGGGAEAGAAAGAAEAAV